jgi:hypothetical protein
VSKKLLSTDFMKRGVAQAKALAAVNEEQILTPSLMLAGILRASDAIKADELPSELTAKLRSRIRQALEAGKHPVPKGPLTEIETSMPLSEDVKNALSSSNGELAKFVLSLFHLVAPPGPNELVEATIKHLPQVAAAMTVEHVTPELFAAAALTAFEAGEFVRKPELAAIFAPNRVYLDLLRQKAPGEMGDEVPAQVSTPPLHPDLLQALQGELEATSAFIAALNLGLKVGVKKYAERAMAYHEAGHAIVHHVLRPHIPMAFISIEPTQQYNGVFAPDGGSPHWQDFTRDGFLDELSVCLAGRGAEIIKFGYGGHGTGARSDIENATSLAWHHIANAGHDPHFGPVSLKVVTDQLGKQPGWLAQQAEQRLREILREAEARTESILRTNWLKVEALAASLIVSRSLDLEGFMNTLMTTGLEGLPGTVVAETEAVERQVVFAREPGSLETAEGTVRFDLGDAIMTGEMGEQWPVPRAMFEQLYEPVSSTEIGTDGLYRKRGKRVRALQLADAARVDLSDGRGVLMGRGGDWIVEYGSGDMAVVSAEVFARTYRVCD